MSQALQEAFDFVLPDNRENMSEEEMAVYLAENIETLKSYLRERGYDLSKSGEVTPQDLLKSIYSNTGTTSYFNPETVDAIASKFETPDDVEASSDSPELATFYGESVNTAASSNLGDSYHESGNQSE